LVSLALPNPAFGEADLSNCEREQIHLAGSIQPHGALIIVRESDHAIVQASANAGEFLGLESAVLGRTLRELKGDLCERIRPHQGDVIPSILRCHLGDPPVAFDALLHRLPGGGLVIEFERAERPVDLSKHLENALQRLSSSTALRALCDQTAAIFKDLTGYDRVMVYRFDEDGHGEVYSEQRQPELEAYLGNRYPASDIPQIARRLYERNRIRVLGDVEYTPVPLTPRLSPLTGQDVDMSMCFLRSMSPIHVQYLKNMGVRATLVASLVVCGKLWGLVACHHYVPRFVSYQIRAACELLAETIATRIAALDGFVQSQATLSVKRMEQRLMEAISREGDWKRALFESPQALLQPLDASGAVLLFEGQVLSCGEVPGTQDLREIARWLDSRPRFRVFATASLGVDQPDFSALNPVASGIVATPISSALGEYVIWFRPERIRTVTWGGNPFKPVVIGDNPADLSPRRSFAQWHQLVEGTSEAWTAGELMAARMIGDAVADVVLQSRSVRMLIIQDQLGQVSRQVRHSGQAVVIADATGRILLTNESFEQLLRSAHPHLEMIEDLAPLFSEPTKARNSLRELIEQQRSWRGEVGLQTKLGDSRPLMVRADPVFSSPERGLGFVLIFTDLTERKVAGAARRRFQQEIIGRHRAMSVPLDSKADLCYRNLLSSVVGNAQLAALEITDGMDLDHMPSMLESVQASVTRSAQLLEHLIWHSADRSESNV